MLTGQPKVDQKTCLSQHQNNMNQSTQSQLDQLPTDPVKDGSKAGQDQPAPLRQSARTTRNQLPWRYQNFTLWWNNTPPSAFNMWDGLHTCLHLMVGLYNIFGKSTLLKPSQICQTQTLSGIDGDSINVASTMDIWTGGSGPKDIWSELNCPTREI